MAERQSERLDRLQEEIEEAGALGTADSDFLVTYLTRVEALKSAIWTFRAEPDHE